MHAQISSLLVLCLAVGSVISSAVNVYFKKDPYSPLIPLPGRLPSDFQRVYYPPGGGAPQVQYAPIPGYPHLHYEVYPPPPPNGDYGINFYNPKLSAKSSYIVYPAPNPAYTQNSLQGYPVQQPTYPVQNPAKKVPVAPPQTDPYLPHISPYGSKSI